MSEPDKPVLKTASFVRFRDTRKAAAQFGLYTLWIGRLRRAGPVVVGVVLLGLIIWPMINDRGMSSLVAQAVPNLMIENLNFSGIDDKNRPYSITADRALQAGNAKNLVDLENPQGEVTLDSGAWLAGRASYGRFDQQGRRLWLGGDVELFHDQGTSFTTSEAQLDMKRNAAWGDQPVLIQGAFGTIEGSGFRMLNGGDVLVIEGHAKAVLKLKK